MLHNEIHRGGAAVLVSHRMWPDMYSVESIKVQVWFRLRCFPDYIFGACYVAPGDSPYFEFRAFSDIHEHVINSSNAVVIGDLNSWLADLSHFDSEHGTYTVNPDTIHNGHGVQVTNLCHNCDLQPVNHYSNHHVECNGGNTFRLGNTWVSQIDWATRSAKSIQPVEEFNIIKDTMLPTNHTLISLEKNYPAKPHICSLK